MRIKEKSLKKMIYNKYKNISHDNSKNEHLWFYIARTSSKLEKKSATWI